MNLNKSRYSDEEYQRMVMFMADNMQACVEIIEHQKYFGNMVEVVKGRKAPVGTKGIVVYLNREHFGAGQFGYATKIGIKTDEGETVYTYASNIILSK